MVPSQNRRRIGSSVLVWFQSLAVSGGRELVGDATVLQMSLYSKNGSSGFLLERGGSSMAIWILTICCGTARQRDGLCMDFFGFCRP